MKFMVGLNLLFFLGGKQPTDTQHQQMMILIINIPHSFQGVVKTVSSGINLQPTWSGSKNKSLSQSRSPRISEFIPSS